MKNAILRLVRVLLAQLIGLGIDLWGNINVPIIGMTIGAVVNAVFKWLRDTYPKATWLVWLPL